MTHFTPHEFVDAAEGTLDGPRRRHLEECEACRREVAALARLMRDAANGPVPEPSPLFWEHFSTRVREAVRAEGLPPAPGWSAWLRWPALAPMAALAALVVAMVATVAPTAPESVPQAVVAAEIPVLAPLADDSTATDLQWMALAELVGPLDWETADAAGLAMTPGDAEVAVLDLDEDERRELSRLITGELSRAKS